MANQTDIKKLVQLVELGVPKTLIARRLGVSRNTIYYHLRKLGVGISNR
jgi:DNA-binding CsgD family transcriptional regulator